MAKNDKSVRRGVYLYIDGKEIKNDVNAISVEIKRLQRGIKDMTIGSEEYNRTMAKIKSLKGILHDHQKELRGITTETKKATVNIGGMVDWFNRFGGVILSVIGFLTGFALALRSIRDERNKLEESQAGLKALTGLDDESITWLTAQAKTLSTTMTKEGLRVRQSAAEILDAFMLVGSAKPELLGDKEALKQVTEEAMRLQAAAKDITLNEAVDSLTLALNQYGAAADQAGRFTNVLAAGSQAGSANVASQAKAIRTAGTAAASANIPIEHTVGLIETLAYRGIKDEVAGTGLKKFFLVLQTGADETNPKLVGLDKALENLKNKKMDAGAIKKMFGEEGFNAASVILQNTEMVNDFTKAVTGTNVAYEQAAINSDTAAAKLAQARNQMKQAAIDLGEKLNPALAVSTNMLTNVIKYLPGLIDWFKEWGVSVMILLAPVLLYNSALKLMNIYQVASNTLMGLARILSLKLTIAKLAETTNFTRLAAATKLYNAEMAKNNILVTTGIRISNALKAVLYSLQIAYYTLTFQLGKARGAMVAFNMVSKMNPYVLLLSIITAIGGAIYLLTRRVDASVKAQKDLNEINKKVGEGVAEEKAKIDLLLASIHNANGENAKRIEAINELKKIIPEYNAEISREGTIINENTEAIKSYLIQLERQMKMSAVSEKMRELYRKQFEQREKVNIRKAEVDNLEKEYANQSDASPDYGGYRAMGRSSNLVAVRNELEKEEKELKDIDFRIENLKTLYGSLVEAPTVNTEVRTIEKVSAELQNAKTLLDKLKTTNTEMFTPGELISYDAQLKKVAFTLNDLQTEYDTLKKQAEEEKKKGNGSTDGNEDTTDKDKFAKVEEAYYKRISQIKRQYLADDKMTQDDYNREMQDAELGLLNDKLTVAGLEPEERQQINDKILDMQIRMRDELRKIEEQKLKDKETSTTKAVEEAEKKQKKESEAAFSRLDKEYQLQVEAATMHHYKNKTSDEEYYNELRRLQNNYYATVLADTTVSEEKKNDIRKQLREAQLNDAEIAYNKEIEQFNRVKDALQDGAKQLGESMAEFFTNEEQDFGDFMKNVLIILLDTLEKQLIATQAAAIAKVTISDISTKGWLGLASAAGKIALITAAFETAKGLLGNFYTGGYTGPGEWDQPKGYVHSNEFVANRFAVSNPNLRPIFDVIDTAQRSGNVGNLTVDDVVAVSGSRSSSSSVPVVASNTSTVPTTSDPALVAMINECSRTLRKLKERLDKDFNAKVYVTGKGGINDAMDYYDQLKNNISRKP